MPAPAQVTLPSDREVRVTRQFNAPRQLVYDAHTKPELIRKWMGYADWDMPICEMDVRVGGKYRWYWKHKENGKQFGFFGPFTEVDAPARLAHDQYFDAGNLGGSMPAGDPCEVWLDLQERSGVPTLVCNMKFASKEARDGAVATGMTDGMEFGYTRLDVMAAEAA
ncbi:MAG: SRPBCC domain-containing protein [Vitreimonas sp.]